LPIAAELWERLFEDEASKDVEVVSKDGDTLKVHRVILTNLSDSFKAMFAHEMRECLTLRIQLTDFTKAQLQFFFRLAYTGHMLPEEWPQDQEESESKGKGKKGYVKGKKGRGILTPRTFASLARSYSDMFDSDSDDGKESKQRPPLDLLFGAVALSKKYDVQTFLPRLIHKIDAQNSPLRFNEVASFAIAHDIAPLRNACRRVADCSYVRQQFDEEMLSPEVRLEFGPVLHEAGADRRGWKRRSVAL
jgi:hypothetical protein